jgi:hypothetical protein
MKLSAIDTDQDRNPPPDAPGTESDVHFSKMPLRVDVPLDTIREKHTSGEAFKLACDASGLEAKEIYMSLGIDQGYFSNIRKGIATLKADKEPMFCKRVGNLVYPEWRAQQLGCTMVPTERYAELLAAEQRARELEIRLDAVMQMNRR